MVPQFPQFASPMLSEESNRFGFDGAFTTTSAAVCDVPLMFAESVTLVAVVTVAVVTVKFALKLPAGTVTLAGTEALGSLLDKGTVNPPDGAALASETVPCAESPPMTDVGATDNASAACITVTKPTLLLLAPRASTILEVMVKTVLADTAGGLKTAVVPLACIAPPSADHWYCTVSPFKSLAPTRKVAVSVLWILSALGAGPWMK